MLKRQFEENAHRGLTQQQITKNENVKTKNITYMILCPAQS